ncbi:substrate-binding periplasmic protein [Vogesella indigofera]|uniref:substrate-binding periplasmic protein n=1 Tax=Vogesella indigofera TaxID=45465 RepID=UPI00234ED80C|nr:transporter substrate-binding domain-containing protein [Vogesella indigofera]MDC7697395.1 transporter substrate-binding domain-containing protein [Vogesella indigofera]
MKQTLRHGLSLLLAMASWPVAAQPPITLHYYERPPFMVRQDSGGASGLTADRARRAFARAGIPIHWALTPAKRQLALLRANGGHDCAVGWFRTPQRQAYALFSRAIYQDRGVVLIARSQWLPPAGSTLEQLLANDRLHLLYKDGLTYGSYVQSKLGMAKADINYSTMEQPQLLRMVAAGRADAMFATREEAEMLLTSGESGHGALQLLAFPDVGAGDTRHILCSRRVGDALMRRLDAAIATEIRLALR